MAITVIIQLALAGGLFLLGWWGRRRGAVLVAATLPEEVRIRRVTVLRRGALTCSAGGGLVRADHGSFVGAGRFPVAVSYRICRATGP